MGSPRVATEEEGTGLGCHCHCWKGQNYDTLLGVDMANHVEINLSMFVA